MRAKRPEPFRDDKAIASWNGLALAALADAGYLLERPTGSEPYVTWPSSSSAHRPVTRPGSSGLARSSRPSSRAWPEEELGHVACRSEPVGALEPVPGIREGREREPVPRGDRLVVAERLRPLRAHVEQTRAQDGIQLPAHDQPLVLEGKQQLRVEPGVSRLVERPRIRQPFDAIGVGILGGREPPPSSASSRSM